MSEDSPLVYDPLSTIDEVSSAAQSNAPSPGPADDDNDSDEEFVYPGVSEVATSEPLRDPSPPAESLVPSLPQSVSSRDVSQEPEEPSQPPPAPKPTKTHPSPAQLESLQAAASSGDLSLLQKLFRTALQTGDVEPFALANDASPRTGLTALHAASSRGYLDIVKWLVEECGAIPDIEDKEGETALHKAALHGHKSVITYLIPGKADVHTRDNDGWTALHNACSKGYLDIVRYLCEQGGASDEFEGTRGVDVKSKGGWTPLMNAASKGHLPVVLYLLSKQSADPLVRNNWGETAYDVAGAVFEVWICEVLQKAEAEKWRATTVPYNPLSVHTTVPVVIYEHQRLDMRLKTLAVNGGRPKFSASGLGRRGRRAPYELRLPVPDENTGKRLVPAWRSDVQLPLREDAFNLPAPGSENAEGAERSHFWLSDWTLDITHPSVDAEEGWQYAHSFDDTDDAWTAEQPAQLQRLLTGTGAMTAGLGGTNSSSSSRSRSATSHAWVRRRRWVRVMRRRLDIPPLPFMQPDGALYLLDSEGALVPYVPEQDSDDHGAEGQELGSMPSSGLTSAQDYVARARYLAGAQNGETESIAGSDAVQARRAIAKLERATTELRQGILSDDDVERRTQAEVLLNAYSRELERRRLAAGAQGLLISEDGEGDYDDDDSDEESFHYPGSSPHETIRPPSVRSGRSGQTDYFSRSAASSRGPTDLTPHLSQASEFRVPTHEAPQKILSPRWTTPTPHQVHPTWERDEAATQCRSCGRRFNFITRRHCRRCGRIFCDRCSAYRALLDPSDIVQDPAYAESSNASSSSQRVCQPCYEEVNASVPNGLHASRTNSMERIVVDQRRLQIPSPSRNGETSSQISDLADCPVCGVNLYDVGPAPLQEAHVRNCLEGGSSASPQTAKYLVYKLPEESALIGTECVICLEEFVKGCTVARLSCLCSFHNACLSSWLQRGRSCPVHAR
ncbi:ankyrin unc44 [Phanerochaete sordida]|uniref:Ankyrin unc44 n=1 Tax=Phanerochaete sordida TaxID=48140 RepID=A0A9P3FXM8_9APHY|nr:ankyrin unc44 [Phanerochaete sordida]